MNPPEVRTGYYIANGLIPSASNLINVPVTGDPRLPCRISYIVDIVLGLSSGWQIMLLTCTCRHDVGSMEMFRFVVIKLTTATVLFVLRVKRGSNFVLCVRSSNRVHRLSLQSCGKKMKGLRVNVVRNRLLLSLPISGRPESSIVISGLCTSLIMSSELGRFSGCTTLILTDLLIKVLVIRASSTL